MQKAEARARRAKKTRKKIQELNVKRLCVHRSAKHIYAQIFDEGSKNVLASASTAEQQIKEQVKNTSNKEAASIVGQAIAERAKSSGIDRVAFDRSGFKFHGRIKALADSAREHGLNF